jgi:hypothetical protein
VSRHAAPVPRRGPRRWWVTGVVLLLAATACLTVGLRGGDAALAAVTATTSGQVTGPQVLTPAATPPSGDAAASAVGATGAGAPVGDAAVPVTLRIPAIGVATSLGRLGLNPDRTVEVPTDFAQAGWYGLGPVPGQLGSAVILGHVDSYQGPAVFYRLGSLRPGDQVEVVLDDSTVAHFGVTSVTTYPKSEFPAQLVYTPHGGSALNLVTCGGEFDTRTRSYLSNVVVTTTLTGLTTRP